MRVALPKLPRMELSSRALGVLAAFLLALICLAVGYVLLEARAGDRLRASTEAGNVVAAITQNIQRTIELYDLSLQGAADGINDPTVMAAPRALRDAVLFDKAATASFLGEIDVIGPDGNVIACSSTPEPAPRNDRNRDYFRIHAQTSNFGLYVSRPVDIEGHGRRILALSRRITRRDGSFGGIVVGMLDLDSMHALFHQMELGQNGSLTLFRNDGTIIMREPYDAQLIGERRPPPILFDRASRSSQGEYESDSVVDGIRRLFRFHRVGTLPLVGSVGLAEDDIYSQARRRELTILPLVAVCCGLVVLLLVQVGRELRRREEAENALRALVDTDALTGLANRRCFDRVLDAAWRRARAGSTSLTVIMIDVDYFKSYNDTLGHAAGDQALLTLARCFAAHAWRDGDLAARYGGEEFAIVLPDIGSDEAMQVAETLRADVLGLGIEHPSSPFGRLTISAGCASLSLRHKESAKALVAAADTALYRAKRSGRNACEAHGAAPEIISLAS